MLHRAVPTVQNCICYFSTNRPKDVYDSSAVPEEFSFTAFLALFLFRGSQRVCVCVCVRACVRACVCVCVAVRSRAQCDVGVAFPGPTAPALPCRCKMTRGIVYWKTFRGRLAPPPPQRRPNTPLKCFCTGHCRP